MRAGEGRFAISADGSGDTWRTGHEQGVAWGGRGWGTDFSCFRFAVPELAGYDGRAIYMDADMLVLGDVRELMETPIRGAWKCRRGPFTDVSVIECSEYTTWPKIDKMKPSGLGVSDYVQMLKAYRMLDESLDKRWNLLDREGSPDAETRLMHYTTVPWQPYKPYPGTAYTDNPRPEWAARWFSEERLAAAR